MIRLIGEFDMTGTDALLEQVDILVTGDGSRALYIDLAELTFIDSSGIRALLKASERIRGTLVLLSPRPSVAKILDIVRVDTLPGLEVRLDGVASPDAVIRTADQAIQTGPAG